MKFARIYLITLLIVHGLCFSQLSAAEETLQRLFTTAEQRAQIDLERDRAKHPQTVQAESVKQQVSSQQHKLYFEALLHTEKGYSLWLNGRLIDQAQSIYGIWVDPSRIQQGRLPLTVGKQVRWLGLGQVYWVEQDRVREVYEKP